MNRSCNALVLAGLISAIFAVFNSAFAQTFDERVLARIEALEKKNTALETKNAALLKRVGRLEASKAAKSTTPHRYLGTPDYTASMPVKGPVGTEFESGPTSIWRPRFETNAAFLYLQPGGGNLQYGTLVTPLPLPTPNWANQSVDPRFAPAFRVGLRYLPTVSEDIQLNWTHLNATGSNAFGGVSNQMAGPPFLIGPGANAYKIGQGYVSYDYDSVTLDAGHTFCAACAFQFRVFAGLEAARIGQTLTGNFESYDYTNASGYTNYSMFTGVGPRVGTKGQYDLGNFEFTGEIAAAVLVGRSQSHINFVTYSATAGPGIPEPNNQALISPDATQLVPSVEAKLAVAYILPPGPYGQFKIELGYQGAVYADAINQYALTQVATPPVVGTVGVFLATQQHLLSDFTVQGPYVATSLMF